MNLELTFLLTVLSSKSTPVPPDINWRTLSALAEHHGVLPLLHHQTASLPEIPANIRDEWMKDTITSAARGSFLASELDRILSLLTANHITSFPFKGPRLACMLYDQPGLRPFEDLDILVPPDQIMLAADLLIDNGFTPRISMPQETRQRHVADGWGYSLKSPGDEYDLDLATSAVPRYFSCQFQPPNASLTELGTPEHILLLLSIHGTKHLWERLIWICDIHFLLSKHNIAWDKALSLATTCGASRILRLALSASHECLKTSIPPDVWQSAERDTTVSRLTRKILGILENTDLPSYDWRKSIPFHLASRERMADKVRYLARLAFTPSYTTRIPRILSALRPSSMQH